MQAHTHTRALIVASIAALVAVFLLSNRSFSVQTMSAAPPRPPVTYDAVLLANEPPVTELIVKFANATTRSGERQQLSVAELDALDAEMSAVAGVELEIVRPAVDGAWIMAMPGHMSLVKAGEIANQLQALSNVDYAEPNAIMQIDSVPYQDVDSPDSADAAILPFDPLIDYQWHYVYEPGDSDGDNIKQGANLPPAWGITEGNFNTVVAVVDTGLSLNHLDLIGRELAGFDFISSPDIANDGDGRDPNATDPGDWVVEGECGNDKDGNPKPGKSSSWHGTHVAGTIGANTNNDIGVAGVNWKARILPVRVLGKCGGASEDIIAGTLWAAGVPVPNTAGWVPGMPVTYMTNPKPAQVINLSLGGLSDGCPTNYQNAFTTIHLSTNATVVVSAGNDFINAALATPANCGNVITVAAGTVVGSLAYYSNWGPNVDITAPGGDGEYKVLSTYNDGQTIAGNPSYAWLQGTSMAAPHMSGVASLLYGLNPFITAEQVLKTLQFSSRPFPQDKGGINCNTTYCGAGLLDAFVSVLLVPGTPTPTATATVTNTPIPNVPTNTPIPTNTATPTLTPTAPPRV